MSTQRASHQQRDDCARRRVHIDAHDGSMTPPASTPRTPAARSVMASTGASIAPPARARLASSASPSPARPRARRPSAGPRRSPAERRHARASPPRRRRPLVPLLADAKAAVEAAIRHGEGPACTDAQRAAVEAAVTTLEAPTHPRPAESPLVGGDWEVVYSTAPAEHGARPPRGVAAQDVDPEGTHANIPGLEEVARLGARLTATFERADDERGRVPGRTVLERPEALIVRPSASASSLRRRTSRRRSTTARARDQTFVDEEFCVVRAARTFEAAASERGRRAAAGTRTTAPGHAARERRG